MRAALQLDDVAIRFGGVQAVDGVSFAVEQGDFVGLIGPNGAGKTTLIRIVAGMLHPDRGRVRLSGIDVTEEGAATGRTDFTPSKNGPILVMEKVKDPDKLFSYFLESVKEQVLAQKSAPKPCLPKAPKPDSQ